MEMSPLQFVDTTNNHNVVLCKGKPESIENDVQYYRFACNDCKGELDSQPAFFEFVKDGIHEMCSVCAMKKGFKDIYHNNSREVKSQ